MSKFMFKIDRSLLNKFKSNIAKCAKDLHTKDSFDATLCCEIE